MKTIIGSKVTIAQPKSDSLVTEGFSVVTVKLRLLGHALSKRSEPELKSMFSKVQSIYKELDKMESQARKLLS